MTPSAAHPDMPVTPLKRLPSSHGYLHARLLFHGYLAHHTLSAHDTHPWTLVTRMHVPSGCLLMPFKTQALCIRDPHPWRPGHKSMENALYAKLASHASLEIRTQVLRGRAPKSCILKDQKCKSLEADQSHSKLPGHESLDVELPSCEYLKIRM